MSGSSGGRSDPFARLRWSQVTTFLDVVRSSEVRTEELIRRRYSERAQNFDETRRFLETIGVLRLAAGVDELSLPQASADAEPRFVDYVLSRVLAGTNRYQRAALRFLSQFRVVDGAAIYQSHELSRSADSSARNFLMDVKCVVHGPADGQYRIANEFIGFYLASVASARAGDMKQAEEHQRLLGLSAEELVVAFERERLGPECAGQVHHVALTNPGAGYDILSCEHCEPGTNKPRYIEVKAVSQRGAEFHWSQNEVETARIAGDSYWLYLVQVGRDGQPRAEGLKMISDAYRRVIASASEWLVLPDGFICRHAESKGAGEDGLERFD